MSRWLQRPRDHGWRKGRPIQIQFVLLPKFVCILDFHRVLMHSQLNVGGGLSVERGAHRGVELDRAGPGRRQRNHHGHERVGGGAILRRQSFLRPLSRRLFHHVLLLHRVGVLT